MTGVRVPEIDDPQGGRNKIREGDLVHVQARPGRRDGFDAVFRSAGLNPDGAVVDVEVYGGPGQTAGIRTVTPDRVRRRAQTRKGAPVVKPNKSINRRSRL